MRKTILAAGAALAAVCLGANAQFAKTEDAIKYRQSAMFIMGNNLGRLAAMAKGERPFDAPAAQRSAKVVDEMAQIPWEGFVPGSAGDKTKVKGEPWAHETEFKQLQDRLKGETGKLAQSAGSLDTLKQQVGATGQACKACHDKFREQ